MEAKVSKNIFSQTMDSQNHLQNLIDAHHEWLLIDASGKSFALAGAEIEITAERGRLLFAFLDDKGFQTWRVTDFKTGAGEVLLNLTRNFERERARIRLVPRALARDLSGAVELARLERANKTAALITKQFPRTKLLRVELNKENGRFAQIIFEDFAGKRTAVLSDVTGGLTPEILLTTAVLWLVRLENRRKNPVENLWILAEKRQAKKLQKLHALLKESWQSKIFIKEISRGGAETQSAEIVKDLQALRIDDLWRGKARELKAAGNSQLSETTRKIVEFSPAEIDVVFSRNGETLRFNGLPFARVRRIFDKEKIWFGVEKTRQILSENNFGEFTELIENLQKIRSHDSPNRRHAFYTAAPEAWLEASLRRNIKLLDANLILSPVYHQFRAEGGRVDLLALRRDGRLVVIELKTAPDREMAFQTADYWRRIELHRRKGNLQKARLFGEAEIADAPVICYAVAPTLAFHRDFAFFARTLAPEIEIHAFRLAENWRAHLKVLERREI